MNLIGSSAGRKRFADSWRWTSMSCSFDCSRAAWRETLPYMRAIRRLAAVWAATSSATCDATRFLICWQVSASRDLPGLLRAFRDPARASRLPEFSEADFAPPPAPRAGATSPGRAGCSRSSGSVRRPQPVKFCRPLPQPHGSQSGNIRGAVRPRQWMICIEPICGGGNPIAMPDGTVTRVEPLSRSSERHPAESGHEQASHR